jgi:tight adherence protein B
MSAWAMLLLPMVLFGVLNLVSPGYFNPIYDSPDRMMFLYILLGLELTAAFWIRTIINIDA